MSRPAPAPAADPATPDDTHGAIRDAIAGLRSGASRLEDVKAAIAELLYRDLHQAAALRELLDEAHRGRGLALDDYRRLSSELHRLVTEEVPTDGIPESPPPLREHRPAVRTAEIGAGAVLRGRYQLEECIAQGPLSDVYRAGDRWRAELETGHESVAIKVLAPAGDGIVDRRKLRRQALLAQDLAHPNICRVHAVDRDGGNDFVVTEWLEGESLSSLMDRSHPDALDPVRLRAVVESVAAALEHALEQGLVHGDLKPANVFLCADGRVKVLDFGLVRGEATAPAMTPEYASCEVLEGRAPEPSDDIYSFGVMIYRAMSGSRPFGRRTALEAEADEARASRVAGLDDEQWACLEKALAFRRADRDIGALRLAAVLVRAPAIPRQQTEAPVKQRSRSWRTAGLLALCAAAAGLYAIGLPERAAQWWGNFDRPAPVVRSPVVETPAGRAAESAGSVAAGSAGTVADSVSLQAARVQRETAIEAGPSRQPGSAGPDRAADPAESVTEMTEDPAAEPAIADTATAVTVPAAASRANEISQPAVPARVAGGRLGFRDGQYEADESDGFVALRLRAPAGHPGLRLRLTAGAGSAELGSDYALAEQIVEIEPGRTFADVLWPLVDDAREEYLEEVELQLESLNDDYPVTRADALVIIFDDDGADFAAPDLPLP